MWSIYKSTLRELEACNLTSVFTLQETSTMYGFSGNLNL